VSPTDLVSVVVDNDNKVASLSLEAIANQRRFEGA